MDATQITNFQRYIFDALPRLAKLRPTVPECGNFFTLGLNPQNQSFTDQVLQGLPKGVKNLSRQLVRGDNFRAEMVDKLEVDSWPDATKHAALDTIEVCKIGVPFDPNDFVCRAVQAGHQKTF